MCENVSTWNHSIQRDVLCDIVFFLEIPMCNVTLHCHLRLTVYGVPPSVRVSRDVPPLRPPFFTSGTPSVWVFRCQTYSIFHFEPLSLGNICEIFIFSRFFGSFLWKFDTPVVIKIYPMDTPGWKFTPRTPHPYPCLGEVPPRAIRLHPFYPMPSTPSSPFPPHTDTGLPDPSAYTFQSATNSTSTPIP